MKILPENRARKGADDIPGGRKNPAAATLFDCCASGGVQRIAGMDCAGGCRGAGGQQQGGGEERRRSPVCSWFGCRVKKKKKKGSVNWVFNMVKWVLNITP